MKKNKLLIFADRFGTNFSGGSMATVKLMEFIVGAFDEIVVLAEEVGEHSVEGLTIDLYTSEIDLEEKLSNYAAKDFIAYGDFYIAQKLAHHRIPFYFTYHDNWPESKELGLFDSNTTKFQLQAYRTIFESAQHVFSVSESKLPYIQQYTNKVSVIRNGLTQKIEKLKPIHYDLNSTFNVLMAGNVDQRKYSKAVDLFKIIANNGNINIAVDIWGNINDEDIASQLDGFDFVNLKGFTNKLSYSKYHLLLSTSLIENLSLTVVDAIANCTAVLSFDVGGISELIDERNGFLVAPYDTKKMTEHLMSPESINKLSFQKDISAFDWEKSSHKMLAFMKQTLPS